MKPEITVRMVDGAPQVFDSDGCHVTGARSVLVFDGVAHVTIVAAVDGEIENSRYDLTARPIQMEPV